MQELGSIVVLYMQERIGVDSNWAIGSSIDVTCLLFCLLDYNEERWHLYRVVLERCRCYYVFSY